MPFASARSPCTCSARCTETRCARAASRRASESTSAAASFFGAGRVRAGRAVVEIGARERPAAVFAPPVTIVVTGRDAVVTGRALASTCTPAGEGALVAALGSTGAMLASLPALAAIPATGTGDTAAGCTPSTLRTWPSSITGKSMPASATARRVLAASASSPRRRADPPDAAATSAAVAPGSCATSLPGSGAASRAAAPSAATPPALPAPRPPRARSAARARSAGDPPPRAAAPSGATSAAAPAPPRRTRASCRPRDARPARHPAPAQCSGPRPRRERVLPPCPRSPRARRRNPEIVRPHPGALRRLSASAPVGTRTGPTAPQSAPAACGDPKIRSEMRPFGSRNPPLAHFTGPERLRAPPDSTPQTEFCARSTQPESSTERLCRSPDPVRRSAFRVVPVPGPAAWHTVRLRPAPHRRRNTSSSAPLFTASFPARSWNGSAGFAPGPALEAGGVANADCAFCTAASCA